MRRQVQAWLSTSRCWYQFFHLKTFPRKGQADARLRSERPLYVHVLPMTLCLGAYVCARVRALAEVMVTNKRVEMSE